MADYNIEQDLHDNFLQAQYLWKVTKIPGCCHVSIASACVVCKWSRKVYSISRFHAQYVAEPILYLWLVYIQGLPKNFLLVNLINLAKTTESASSTSHFCEGSHGIKVCLDSKFHICLIYKKFHDKIPDTGDHSVIPIEKVPMNVHFQINHRDVVTIERRR